MNKIPPWPRAAGILSLLVAFFGIAIAAPDFSIDNVTSARSTNVADLKSGTIAFSDHTTDGGIDADTALIPFDQWADRNPIEKKFLALYPAYAEPTVNKTLNGTSKQIVEKLFVYVAQARFLIDRAPESIDLSRYVTLSFLDKIDPAIKHTAISGSDASQFKDEQTAGNDNPDRKWCSGQPTVICIQSTYKLEGKIPMGITLVNQLRDSARKVADHIDFQSEFSALGFGDLDQDGLRQLTAIDTPVSGALDQNIFYINQIMKFGKFFAVFQAHPTDASKTVVTAFMVLAIKASVLDEKRGFETVPVLRNLVPAQVLMGQSSFNSGDSISAGLPKYARNEIKTVAGLLEAK